MSNTINVHIICLTSFIFPFLRNFCLLLPALRIRLFFVFIKVFFVIGKLILHIFFQALYSIFFFAKLFKLSLNRITWRNPVFRSKIFAYFIKRNPEATYQKVNLCLVGLTLMPLNNIMLSKRKLHRTIKNQKIFYYSCCWKVCTFVIMIVETWKFKCWMVRLLRDNKNSQSNLFIASLRINCYDL